MPLLSLNKEMYEQVLSDIKTANIMHICILKARWAVVSSWGNMMLGEINDMCLF